ncbi:hypothetical protein [Pseudoxanthomonas wuyuanensis]|uniref:Uncharacterized protein n=1 Tax=Pseudoxanthomonas wuyuanensis TaxID=1073196 RepID=A0A286DDK8_9GAMM|nr:hypothetical protein [Pseudoxanthomonas wuyuanensis]SOD56733.1 hypothetical protein SAMN06296416_110138 [Pseudoxanthomonas wuyuanensis]
MAIGLIASGFRVLLGFALLVLALLTLAPLANARPASTAADPQLRALQQLQRELSEAMQQQADPLQEVLQRHATRGSIDFVLELYDASGNPLPIGPRPPQVPQEDWEHLLKFLQPQPADLFFSENGHIGFILIDLDEDGQRDLLVTVYVGGTGLFSQVLAYRRDPDHGFVAAVHSEYPEDAGYSINGRGGDQQIALVRLDGRTYLAYRDSHYGQDLLTLHRPLEHDAATGFAAPALQLKYRHTHTLAPEHADGDNDTTPRDTKLDAAIARQLQRLAQARRNGKELSDAACPSPADANPEDGNAWPWRDAGHYTFEFVEEFPVRVDDRCYSASIVHFLSSYRMSYESCCSLWLYSAPGEQIAELPLSSQRQLFAIDIVSQSATAD